MFFLSAKNKEVASLKEQIVIIRKNGVNELSNDSEFDEKTEDPLQQLKNAKKAAFVARGNVIKKNMEINHLKNALQTNQG